MTQSPGAPPAASKRRPLGQVPAPGIIQKPLEKLGAGSGKDLPWEMPGGGWQPCS